MGTTIDLRGHPAWYAEYGTGDEALVYLHGGFSDSRELDPVRARYAARFRVYTLDRRGHGRTPDVAGPLDFVELAADVVAFLETVVAGPAVLVGFSDGATTALHVALARPDLVRAMVLISGQFHHDGLDPGAFDDDPGAVARALEGSRPAARYREVSPDGPEHFVVVAEKVVRLAQTQPRLGPDDVARAAAPALVMAGDRDVVTLEHTAALYRALPAAQLAIVPGTSHLLIVEKPALVADLALGFLRSDR